jgi:hypothetical protein
MMITKTIIIKNKFSHRFNRTNNHKILLTFKQQVITITLITIKCIGRKINPYKHIKS